MDRILVIDDDVPLTELLDECLRAEGFGVETAHDGEAGVAKALAGEYALLVLDVMLPRMSGFEVLMRIRPQSQVPVLMLTARGDPVDRVTGLQMGADDYLPKPFNERELVARIQVSCGAPNPRRSCRQRTRHRCWRSRICVWTRIRERCGSKANSWI